MAYTVKRRICNCSHDHLAHSEDGQCYLCECPAFIPLTWQEAQTWEVPAVIYDTVKDRPGRKRLEFE